MTIAPRAGAIGETELRFQSGFRVIELASIAGLAQKRGYLKRFFFRRFVKTDHGDDKTTKCGEGFALP